MERIGNFRLDSLPPSKLGNHTMCVGGRTPMHFHVVQLRSKKSSHQNTTAKSMVAGDGERLARSCPPPQCWDLQGSTNPIDPETPVDREALKGRVNPIV